MEDNKSVFYYISGLFATYGVIVLIFIFLNMLTGDAASGYSTLFEYGSRAFSISTLLQLFALAVIISVLRTVLFSDRWIKNMSIILRNVLFFAMITMAIVFFVIVFRWFPPSDITAWIGFIISFAICSTLGILISRIREKTENDKMNRALEKYRDRTQEE